MSLTWHIVRKDARRLGPLAAAWAALIVAGLGLMAVPVHQSRPLVPGAILPMLLSLLGMFQLMIAYLLTSVLWHEDPAVGRSPSWVSRPISGARMFGAKLASTVLWFWLLPVAVALPWWLAFGYRWADLPAAAAQTLAFAALPTLLALPLAVLSENISRFFGYTMVALLGLVAACVALIRHQLTTRFGAFDLHGANVLPWLLLAVTWGVAAHQYITRWTRRTIALLAGGLGMIILVGGWWPNVAGGAGARPDHAARGIEAASVLLQLQRAVLVPSLSHREPEAWLRLELEARGLPSGWGVLIENAAVFRADQTVVLPPTVPAQTVWVLPDGRFEVLTVKGELVGRDAWARHLVGDLSGRRGDDGPGGVVRLDLSVPPPTANRFKEGRPEAQVRLRFRLVRGKLEGLVPLRPGAVSAAEDTMLGVDALSLASQSAEVSWWQRGPGTLTPGPDVRFDPLNLNHYWLLSRPRGEIAALGTPLAVSSVSFNGVIFAAGHAEVNATGDPVAWLATADLAVVKFEDEGVITQTLNLSRVEIAATPTTGRARLLSGRLHAP